MKEFKNSNIITYNLMSFTGFKSLMLFSLLLESPKSYEEVCEFFRDNQYINEEISTDTFRVYLNSLRRVGCEIVKLKKSDGGKYKLIAHPFELRVYDEHIKSLMKIYRILIQTVTVPELLIFDKFVRNLADKIENPKLHKSMNKFTVFKGAKLDMVEELIHCTRHGRIVEFIYNSPKSGKTRVQVKAEKVELIQNKLYFSGINWEHKTAVSFRVSKIVKIISSTIDRTSEYAIEPITIGYEILSRKPDMQLNGEEKIVEIREESIIVEFETSNLFAAKRRILSLGARCRVLYPDEFREEIISSLKKMREGYGDD